jgi:hypothetical protein
MQTTERANGGRGRSAGELVRDIVSNAGDLARKEMALARLEARRSVEAKAQGAVAFGLAGAAALLAVVFGGLAAAAGLALVMPAWAASLVVMGGFLLVAVVAALVGRRRMGRPVALDETKRTLKEDAGWAKAQLTS